MTVSPRTLADLVLTGLLLNLLGAAIQGGAAFDLLGATWRTPSFGVSAMLVVLWVAGRHLLARGTGPALAGVRPWVRQHPQAMLVGGLFVVALALRLRGIDFGAPLILHPDEHVVIGKTLTMLKAGSLRAPEPYQYPTFLYYLLLPLFGLRYVRGKSAGLWSDLSEVDVTSFEFYLVARGMSAVTGALTVVLVFVLASRLWPGARGRWAGVIAAALLTFAFNHVKESHYAVTDATLTCLIVAAFIAIVAALRHGTPGRFALAGWACGLACATKYSALPLVFVLIAAHLYAGQPWRRWRRLAAGLVAVPAGFFTGYPYALFNWPPFLEHLGWMSSFSRPDTFDAAARFGYIVRYAAESGFGLPVTLLLGVAIVVGVHRRRAEAMLAIVFIAGALSLMANTAFPFYPRYLLPLMPFALILVGWLVVDVTAAVSRRGLPIRHAGAAAAVLVVGAIVPQALESASFIRHATSPDTRVLAREFLAARLPAGAVVASEEPYLTLPDDLTLVRWMPLHEHLPEEFVAEGVTALVFTDVRDVNDGTPAARARFELRRRFQQAALFLPGHEGAVGPGIAIYLVDGQRP